MDLIRPDLNDQLLRRQIQDKIELVFETGDLRMMKEVAELMAESYIQARVSAKYLGRESARNLGTAMTSFSHTSEPPQLDGA